MPAEAQLRPWRCKPKPSLTGMFCLLSSPFGWDARHCDLWADSGPRRDRRTHLFSFTQPRGPHGLGVKERLCLTFSSPGRLEQLGTRPCLHSCSDITSSKQGQALCRLDAQSKPPGHFTYGDHALFPRLPNGADCHLLQVNFSSRPFV